MSADKINIDIKRTGYPVTVGEFEFFFDSSFENLKTFASIEDVVDSKAAEIEAKIDEMPDIEDYDKALLIMKAQAEIAWDMTFGEGTFDKLYAKYPDVWALTDIYETVGEELAKKIEKLGEERVSAINEMKSEALAKKAQKTSK